MQYGGMEVYSYSNPAAYTKINPQPGCTNFIILEVVPRGKVCRINQRPTAHGCELGLMYLPFASHIALASAVDRSIRVLCGTDDSIFICFPFAFVPFLSMAVSSYLSSSHNEVALVANSHASCVTKIRGRVESMTVLSHSVDATRKRKKMTVGAVIL